MRREQENSEVQSFFSKGEPILEPSAGCGGTIEEDTNLKTVYGNN